MVHQELSAGVASPATDQLLRARPETTSMEFMLWVAEQETQAQAGQQKEMYSLSASMGWFSIFMHHTTTSAGAFYVHSDTQTLLMPPNVKATTVCTLGPPISAAPGQRVSKAGYVQGIAR
eukprot:1138926-Pelagomonas_calceolata.AAC.7